MKKKTLVELVADAVQALNLDADKERGIRIGKGRYLNIRAASGCDLPTWTDAESPTFIFSGRELSDLSPFQRKHGGASGLYFCESDKDGQELDDSEGGQFDGYLSNWSAKMPRKLALQCAADLLESVGAKVS